VTPIAVYHGLRGAFWFTGLIGAIWLLSWLIVSRGIGVPAPTTRGQGVQVRDLRLWAFMAVYALGGLPLAFVIYGASLYLNQDRGIPQQSLGTLLWIPPLGWEVGYFVWGWLADRFWRSGAVSMKLLLGAATVLSAPLALAPAIRSTTAFMVLLFFAMFAGAGFIILSVAYATGIFSVSSSGLVAGFGAGSWSAVVAIVMPFFGRMLDRQSYDLAFVVAAVFPIAGYALWRLLDRSAPDVRRL
jgi:ACS family hexuronate transporter-like MFS transporter